jgi:hypothetical protein
MLTEDEDLIDFAEARPAGLHNLKLLAFWFWLYDINREQGMYDCLVSALTKEAISLVLDEAEHPPEYHPYTDQKQNLLDTH